MKNKIIPYIELTRLNKPIGIYLLLWPALLGLILSSINTQLTFKNIFIVILGSIIVRSCGCVINDISDYRIDMHVKRTVNRPLANQSISIVEAWILFIILGIISLVLLFFTNPLTIKISIFFALLITLYPLSKRFIRAPQFILGITFGSSCLIAYSLQSNEFTISLAILYIGIVAWIISFDTYYALEDKEDDLKININSTAILWGKNAVIYSKLLQITFYTCLLIIGIINKFSYLFLIGLLVLILIFIYQSKLIKNKMYIDAFKINNFVGMTAVIFFILEIIL
ncbi:MAG: 4-hydroxybenzoate octaprenyltransferase [Gammaproteobacteria bacterium]|tara:strand:+ start:7400 stop:8248 length:849 start_codon:yes stop_codon:yes gene_type:complete